MHNTFTDEPSLLVVTCSSGVAPFLAVEIETLGFRVDHVSESAIETYGTLADCMTLNMHLRTAHRVLYALDRVRASNADYLYRELVRIPWENYLDPHGYFSVDRAVNNPTIHDTQFASLKVKDAIADRMREACGSRPKLATGDKQLSFEQLRFPLSCRCVLVASSDGSFMNELALLNDTLV